jgi:hypothetical protein
MELDKVTPMMVPATHQPPTPLSDCNSALAQLTKDLNVQEQKANLQKGELIRTAMEQVLGELGFLRLYRAARIEKRKQRSQTSQLLSLMDHYNQKETKADARIVCEQMFDLLDLEDM